MRKSAPSRSAHGEHLDSARGEHFRSAHGEPVEPYGRSENPAYALRQGSPSKASESER